MSLLKTPVSVLQELLQKSNTIPQYDLLPSDGLGTHNPTFRFRVDAGKVIGFGKARSKKEAKHEAAKDALAKFTELGLYIPDQSATPPLQTSPVKQEPESPVFQINAVGMLKDFVVEHNLPHPEFIEISDVGPAHQRLFTLQCTVGPLKRTATEYTKKKAKQSCAQLMYQCLLESLPSIGEPDDIQFLSINDEPSIDAILEQFNSSTINFGKKKENYKLKIAGYTQTLNKIMKEKDLSYKDLWQDVNSTTEMNLAKVLLQLDLKYTIESFNNENNVIVFLTIDSEPIFSISKIATSKQEAIPYLIRDAFDFLMLMTTDEI